MDLRKVLIVYSTIKKYKLLIIIFFSAVLVSTFLYYNQKLKYNSNVAATVNGEPIHEYEIENALNRYKETDITRDDIITIAAKEILVIQEAEKLGVTIDDNDLEQKVKTLKDEYPKYYELAVEQYEDISVYKEALRYKMIYDIVKEKIIEDYLEENPLDDEILKQKMIEEGIISEKEFNDKRYDDLKHQFIEYNNENRGNRFFEEWTDSLLNKADVVTIRKR